MSFSEPVLDEIRRRVSLVEYVGRSVPLKQATADRWAAPCPFHEDKDPSFTVSPSRGRYKCFGCNESGDIFGFVMKADGLSFPAAVRRLAEEAGVELEAARSGGGSRNRAAGGPRTGGQPVPQPATVRPRGEVRPIGDAKGAKIAQTYDYTTKKGRLVYQVCRMEPKSFRQRRPHPKKPDTWVWTMGEKLVDGVLMPNQPTILYRIPELAAALLAEDMILICEGEKDADAARALDLVATCNSGGAGKWRDELSQPFTGFQGAIRIIQDRDDPGEKHAMAVFESVGEVKGDRGSVAIFVPLVGKDLSDHLAAGHSLAELRQVWPLPEDLIQTDPRRAKRIMLEKALQVPTIVLRQTEHEAYQSFAQPHYVPGLANLVKPMSWQGCVVVSGMPSTAKSFLTIATAVDNAELGWDVYYLTCEMPENTIRDRAARAIASRHMSVYDWQNVEARQQAVDRAKSATLPERLAIVDVGLGVTIQDVIEFLSDRVTERPTLVVLDSVSSFVDNMVADASDSFGMSGLREVQRWVTGVSRLTHGQIAFLLLSEINKEGRARGRSLDHRCDFALSMTSSEEDHQAHVKTIRTTKSWHGPTGKVGEFVLWPELGRLVRMTE